MFLMILEAILAPCREPFSNKCSFKNADHEYPSALFQSKPGSIKLVMGERNVLFVQFHDVVKEYHSESGILVASDRNN